MDVRQQDAEFAVELMRRQAQFEERMLRQFAQRLQTGGDDRQVRLAKTFATGEYPYEDSYPPQGVQGSNTFPIIFMEAGFKNVEGRNPPQGIAGANTSQALVLATSYNWIPPDTHIEVYRSAGTNANFTGEWWTQWKDNVRTGIVVGTIPNGGNGYVRELVPNEYERETTGRKWLVRNVACPTLTDGTKVYFQQHNSVAYAWRCCCDGDSSSSTSGSDASGSMGSEDEGSGLTGSEGTGGGSGNGTGPIDTQCCWSIVEDPDDWPSQLNLTISGACCPQLNQSLTLYGAASAGGIFYSSTGANNYFNGVRDCTGRVVFEGNEHAQGVLAANVFCNADHFEISFNFTGSLNRLPPIRCNPFYYGVNGRCSMTLLNCNPLHLVYTGAVINVSSIPPSLRMGTWCDGLLNFEVTV